MTPHQHWRRAYKTKKQSKAKQGKLVVMGLLMHHVHAIVCQIITCKYCCYFLLKYFYVSVAATFIFFFSSNKRSHLSCLIWSNKAPLYWLTVSRICLIACVPPCSKWLFWCDWLVMNWKMTKINIIFWNKKCFLNNNRCLDKSHIISHTHIYTHPHKCVWTLLLFI